MAWQADAGMIMDDVITEFISKQTWFIKLSAEPYSTTPNALGIRQSDPALAAFLNTAIDMLQAQWIFESLWKKYKAMRYAQKNNFIPLNQ